MPSGKPLDPPGAPVHHPCIRAPRHSERETGRRETGEAGQLSTHPGMHLSRRPSVLLLPVSCVLCPPRSRAHAVTQRDGSGFPPGVQLYARRRPECIYFFLFCIRHQGWVENANNRHATEKGRFCVCCCVVFVSIALVSLSPSTHSSMQPPSNQVHSNATQCNSMQLIHAFNHSLIHAFSSQTSQQSAACPSVRLSVCRAGTYLNRPFSRGWACTRDGENRWRTKRATRRFPSSPPRARNSRRGYVRPAYVPVPCPSPAFVVEFPRFP